MGLGQRAVYPLETDERGLIRPERLPAAYERVLADNKRPFALVACAGTTVAGLYDPLAEIGAFCRQRDLWLHVDGAHGGPALLTGRYRHLVRGVELADSFCMNMHKLMQIPALCTALLVRDAATLDRALSQDASYLFFDKAQPGVDFVHRTIECTKPVMGLKFLLVLAAQGESGVAAAIERQFELTRAAYDYLSGLPDFECPLAPQSNILCFRVKGLNVEHLALRDRLLARGNYYVSSAAWNGERYLRLTLTNPATTLAVIEGMVSEIRALLAGEGRPRVGVEE